MCWNDVEVDMKEPTCTVESAFYVQEETFISDQFDHIAKILDGKYVPANLPKLTANLPGLNNGQKEKLLEIVSDPARDPAER